MSLPRRPAVRSVELTSAVLARYAAARPLALAPSSIGRIVALAAAPYAQQPSSSSPPDAVAVVTVLGPLAQRAEVGFCGGFVDGYDSIADRVCGALATPSVRSVVLVIDSPGGDVAGLEQAVARIRAARDAAGKPILCYVDECAASAAYWLAAAVCDGGVYLPESGAVGSIGIVAIHVEESVALGKAGVAVTIIRSGAAKYLPNSVEPLDARGRAILEALVADSSSRFFAAMAAARGVSVDAIRKLDGAAVYGAAAVRARLADGVASLADVIERAAAPSRSDTRSATASTKGTENMGKKARKAAALGVSLETYKIAKRAEKAAKAAQSPSADQGRNSLEARAQRLGVAPASLAAAESAMGTEGTTGAIDAWGKPLAGNPVTGAHRAVPGTGRAEL